MNEASALGRLGRAAGTIEIAARMPDAATRSEGMARAMLQIWPDAVAVGCRLAGADWAALDPSGQRHADGAAAFVHPSLVSDMGPPPTGELAVRLASPKPDDEAALRLLALAAAGALRSRPCQEFAEQAEMVSPLLHEFNNLLNTLSLRLMLVEQDLPAAHAEPVARIRARSAEMAKMIANFQTRRPGGAARLPADLAALVAEVAAVSGRRVETTSGEPTMALGDPDSLRILVGLLLRFAAAHSAAGPAPRVSFDLEAAWARLTLETAGPALEAGVDYFKPRPPGPHDATGLELAACRSLVYRAAGRLNVSSLPSGRVAILLDLPSVGA